MTWVLMGAACKAPSPNVMPELLFLLRRHATKLEANTGSGRRGASDPRDGALYKGLRTDVLQKCLKATGQVGLFSDQLGLSRVSTAEACEISVLAIHLIPDRLICCPSRNSRRQGDDATMVVLRVSAGNCM